MVFKFGFGEPSEGSGNATAHAEEEQPEQPSIYDQDAEEVAADEGKPTGSQETVAISSDLTLIKGVVSNAQAASLLSDERVEQNDLIAGVYEGGFKTWEGGMDLAQFLALRLQRRRQEQDVQQQQEQQQGAQQGPALELGPQSRVMELGCGHGLPGLVALWAGAEVHFQDYNRSVLTTLTIQNVAANRSAWATRRQALGAPAAGTAAAAATQAAGEEPGAAAGAGASGGARYFAGSWGMLCALLEERGLARTYDLVLTAETIYSLEAMASLYRCIKACLRPGAGVALVAAKSYYFGVGGGTAAFARLVEEDGAYECSTVAVVDDGKSNKREILMLAPRAAATAQRQ